MAHSRPSRSWRPAQHTPPTGARFGVLVFALSVGVFGAIVGWPAPSADSRAAEWSPAGLTDHEQARFAVCGVGRRINCVIDGDTFWYGGEKIRLADINAPEVTDPDCPRERQLGAAATARLRQWLNAGAFSLATSERDRDAYGRLLRTVTRDGASVGVVLVDEGLAEQWRGRRGSWC